MLGRSGGGGIDVGDQDGLEEAIEVRWVLKKAVGGERVGYGQR